jgi:hypothetical protein
MVPLTVVPFLSSIVTVSLLSFKSLLCTRTRPAHTQQLTNRQTATNVNTTQMKLNNEEKSEDSQSQRNRTIAGTTQWPASSRRDGRTRDGPVHVSAVSSNRFLVSHSSALAHDLHIRNS